jgi:hypothetical protein
MAISQQTNVLEGSDRSLNRATPPLLKFSVMPRNHDRDCSGNSIGERAAIRTPIPKAKRGNFLFSSKCGSLRRTTHKRRSYRGLRHGQLIKRASPVLRSAYQTVVVRAFPTMPERVETSILTITSLRKAFTVLGLICNRPAISLVVRPSNRYCTTSFSRAVR